MNRKIQRLVAPSMRMYLAILVLFSIISFFFEPRLAFAEGIAIVLLVIYSIIASRKNRKLLMDYIESITYNVESAKNNTLLNFPLPMVVYSLEDYQVIWGNQNFFDICSAKHLSYQAKLNELIPSYQSKWLFEGKSTATDIIEVGGRKYQIHGNIVQSNDNNEHDFIGVTYWMDVTEFEEIKQEYNASRPVIAMIVLDNYDELLKNLNERERTELRNAVEDKIASWCEGKGGILRRYDRDRYLFMFEERHLSGFIEARFSILEEVHTVVNPSGIHATISIGIGKDGVSMEELYHFANLSSEMALSRGGDQVVIKNRFTFEFFGGRGSEIETRTKVKSRVMANAMTQLISDASQTFVMGHKFADMDALGAAVGVCCIARAKGAKVRIVIDLAKNACSHVISKLQETPEYADIFITPAEAMLLADTKTLLVVVDTNRPEQVEDEALLTACNKVVVIDHHRRAATYIQNAALTLYEPYASSVCELMAELLQELVLQAEITDMEAQSMLAGIVMDTKNFTMRTGERTFDAAAFLRRAGADTAEVKKLMQNDLDNTIQKYRILQNARIYRDGLALATPDHPQDRVVAAQAADELLNISGVTASIVAYPTKDGGAIVSARSIGDINVQVLLECLGGGGNKSAAGAQMKNISFPDAISQIHKAIDQYFD